MGDWGNWRLPSRSDAMTIARHFNAGFNPQNIPSPEGMTGFSEMKSCAKCGDDLSFVQPSRWDSRRGRRIPGVETPGYCRVVPLGRAQQTGRALRNSQCAIRNCHGSFPVFILGWTIGAFGGWAFNARRLTLAWPKNCYQLLIRNDYVLDIVHSYCQGASVSQSAERSRGKSVGICTQREIFFARIWSIKRI